MYSRAYGFGTVWARKAQGLDKPYTLNPKDLGFTLDSLTFMGCRVYGLDLGWCLFGLGFREPPPRI